MVSMPSWWSLTIRRRWHRHTAYCLDPAFARKISEKAREDVNSYTWERRAGKILEFINSSMSEKRRAAA